MVWTRTHALLGGPSAVKQQLNRLRRLLRVGLSASISVLMVAGVGPPLLAPVALAAGPAFVQAASTTAAFKISFTNAVGAGDLLVAGITTNDGGTDPITAVSDNLNGAWTKLTSLKYGNGHVELYYFSNSIAGTDAVTFTTSNTSKQAFTIAEYSGVNAATPVDQFTSKARTGSPTAGPTLAIGGAGELVIGVGGMSAPTSFSAGTGFTMRAQAVSNYLYGNGLEDSISSSNTGQSMTMVPATNSNSYSGAIVAVFLTGPAPNPQAALVVNPSSGAAPLAVTLDASGSSDPVGISTYTFAFGDGTTAGPQAAATATHSYAAGGNFTATVTIKDTAGRTATATAAVVVGAPVAVLKVTQGGSGMSFNADASGSSDPIGISSYTFDFGDGTALVGPQAGGTGSHTYATTGTYTVTATVADSVGATASATASAVAQATPLIARLVVSPASGLAPLAVTADASTSTPGTSPIASYSFNFGDGSPAVGPQPGATAGHTYATTGSLTVTVTVTDTSGASKTATAGVTISTPPAAALTVTPASGTTPLPVTANASGSTAGSNPIASYTFIFGDGSAAVGPQAGATANHTYSASGSYTVTLTVTDTAGYTSTATASVTATAPLMNGTITGTVTDSASVAPIAGAQVSTQPASSTAVTNASGAYQLSVPAGTYNVIVTASGYNSNFKSVSVSSGASATANQALLAVPALTAQDLFSRPNQTGIGPASDGHTWTDDLASNPTAIVQINNQQLYLQTTGTTYDAWMGIPYQDQEVAADVNILAGSARLLARAQANGTWLVLMITPSSNTLTLWVAKNNTWTQLQSWAAAPVLTQNTWYHAKLRAVGTNVFGKAWVFGSPEPAWQISATQSQVTGTGVGGLRSSGSTGYFANFSESPVTQVTGTVTDSVTTLPIAGATVAITNGPTTTSTSTGAYVLAGLTAGTYTVTASAPGYAASSQPVTVSNSVSTTANFTLVATGPPPTNSNIIGNVTDSTTGTAIAGAQVYTQPATTSVTTDNAGNYLLTVLAGSYSVLFSAGQHNTDFATVTTVSGGTSTVNMALSRVPAGAAQDVFSRPNQNGIGIASDGRTWTDDHAVYPTGTEQIASRLLWVQTATATTDYDAWMGIPYQDQEVTLDFNATSGGIRVLGRVQASETWVVLAVNPSSNNLALWAANNNVWTLLTSSGTVTVNQNTWYHAKLDVIGQKVQGKVWAFGAGEPGWQIGATQTIVNGTGVGGLRFAGSDGYVTNFLQKPITQITGTISDSATGKPVSNASVTLSNGATTTTDVTGAYLIGSLGAGTYTVSATAPGYGSAALSATVSTGASTVANLSITATLGTTNSQISGVVTDSTSGAPIAGSQVSTQPASSTAVTNAGGGYTLAVAAGTFNVIFTASGYNSNFKTVSVSSGATATANQALVAVPALTAQDLFSRPNQTGIGPPSDGHAWTDDLASNPSAVVQITNQQLYLQTSGTAYDAWMGIPYQDQEVAADVDMVAGGVRLLARVQGNGSWLVLTIAPGSNGALALWVAKNNTWTQLKSWTATPSFTQNTWYHAKLRVVGTTVSAKVWAFGSPEPAWQVSATQSTLTGSGVGGLRSSSATDYIANFSQSPVTQIAGTVTSNASKQPIAGATVTLSNGATTTTDTLGNYVFANVTAGAYTVTASASGFTTSAQSFTVSTGISATANFAL
ncbi:MAG TPA: carboxypeptidase regulatory-like domain-containing protein [Candidatus Dormibacteraeota bacterium]|nr:carboxypeptidase regulatory-like domain-containing protein [Candidatus Dormibacteraeota bacterium]